MSNSLVPTLTSKPASEEIFGRKFEPCKMGCPPPRECHESLRAYKPAYYEPWCLCACPSTRIKMLNELSSDPIGAPVCPATVVFKLPGLRMTDCYRRYPRNHTVYCTSKYKTDYCRPIEQHILPHRVQCVGGAHLCPRSPCLRDACGPPAPHRRPRYVWRDGYHSLNYAEEPIPYNPVLSPAQWTKSPSDDFWNLPCVTRRHLPLPKTLCTCRPIPGGEKSILLAHRPWDPCSTFFGGPGERTKHIRRLRREALGRKILAEARENPFPCGTLPCSSPWKSWSAERGVYCAKRPPFNPVLWRAGIKTGLTLGKPCKKTLDF